MYPEECPPEIWHEIFDKACRDDGKTARALSLVSRRFHQLSKYHRLYSLAITDTLRLFRLCELLNLVPRSLRTTRYLYIRIPRAQITSDVYQTIRDVLSMVARTLEVLTICYVPSTNSKIEDQFPPLPRLLFLSLYFENSVPESKAFRGPRRQAEHIPADFPLLQDLQVFGKLHSHHHWRCFVKVAPKVSMISSWSDSISSVLQHCIDVYIKV
jgi:hypothetical protein